MTKTNTRYQQHPHQKIMGHYLICVYQKMSLEEQQGVINFWKNNQAVTDPIEAQRRCHEVVYIACDLDWNIVGLSTTGITQLKNQGEYYYFRMFVQPKQRGSYLSVYIFTQTSVYLLQQALKNQILGLIVVTENKRMMQPGFRRWFKRHHYEYLGLDSKGCDIWLSKSKKRID